MLVTKSENVCLIWSMVQFSIGSSRNHLRTQSLSDTVTMFHCNALCMSYQISFPLSHVPAMPCLMPFPHMRSDSISPLSALCLQLSTEAANRHIDSARRQ